MALDRRPLSDERQINSGPSLHSAAMAILRVTMHSNRREMTMKKILSIALAAALMGGTAAYAGPHGHGGYRGHGSYHGYYHRHHHNNDGAAIAAGIGALALFAIIASQNQQDRQPEAYGPPPPPPENAYPQDYQGQYGAPQDGPYYDGEDYPQ